MRMTFSSKFLSSQEIIYIYQPDRPFYIFLLELGSTTTHSYIQTCSTFQPLDDSDPAIRQSLHKYCFFFSIWMIVVHIAKKMYLLPFFNVCSKIGLLSVSKEKDEKTASAWKWCNISDHLFTLLWKDRLPACAIKDTFAVHQRLPTLLLFSNMLGVVIVILGSGPIVFGEIWWDLENFLFRLQGSLCALMDRLLFLKLSSCRAERKTDLVLTSATMATLTRCAPPRVSPTPPSPWTSARLSR